MKKLESGSLEKNNFEKDDSEKSSLESGDSEKYNLKSVDLEKENSEVSDSEKYNLKKDNLVVYGVDGGLMIKISEEQLNEIVKRIEQHEEAVEKAKKYYKDYKRKPIYRFWVFEEKKMIEFKDFKSIEYSGNKNEHFTITTKTGETYRDDQGALLAPIEIRNKKGKRVFEGDLIKDACKIFYIYYDPDTSSFETAPIDKKTPFRVGLNVERAHSLNIIGNIFQSDEIVKDKNISWPVRF